jgi:hypothetical protein
MFAAAKKGNDLRGEVQQDIVFRMGSVRFGKKLSKRNRKTFAG